MYLQVILRNPCKYLIHNTYNSRLKQYTFWTETWWIVMYIVSNIYFFSLKYCPLYPCNQLSKGYPCNDYHFSLRIPVEGQRKLQAITSIVYPCKSKIPVVWFPCKVPVVPCKPLQCRVAKLRLEIRGPRHQPRDLRVFWGRGKYFWWSLRVLWGCG